MSEDVSSDREYRHPGRADYESFAEAEAVPVHRGFAIPDVRTVEVADWPRTGGRGCLIDLVGHGGLNDVHIHEIPPGGSLEPTHHLYSALVYVVSGRGLTVIEDDDGDAQRFEWSEASLFSLPRNTRYRHVNLDPDEPARLLAETDLPTVFNLFFEDEIFEPEASFQRRVDYGAEGRLYEVPNVPVIWESSFVADTTRFDQLADYGERGAGGTSVKFNFPNMRLRAHMSEFPVGTYKKAHRHPPGANLLTLGGEGYTLMWSSLDPDERVRIDWKPGTLSAPPNLWWHQHFNLSDTPSRYLAIHPPAVAPMGPDEWYRSKAAHNQIEYVDEDEAIREEFEAELEKRDLETRMPEACYTDPDYEF